MICTDGGVAAATKIRDALAAAGLHAPSRTEVNGWTQLYGSTGFSLRLEPDGAINWHVVICGKQHLAFREYELEEGDETYDCHDPIAPEQLYPRISSVFEALGIKVSSISCCGHQTMWDHGVEYNVATKRPSWL